MQEILNTLLEKKFDYKGKIIIIKSWKKVYSIYVVICDKRSYNFYESEIVEFVNSLQELKTKETIFEKKQKKINENKMENQKVINEQEVIDIKEVLYQAIRDVKSDKGYIPQANSICKIITQLINLKKIDFLISSKQKK